MQNWLMFKQRFLFDAPLKIPVFSHYCVAHTVNKRFKYMSGLRNVSTDNFHTYECRYDQ